MRGEYVRNFAILLVAILIAGCFGIVLGARECSAEDSRAHVAQCSVEFLSGATDINLLDGHGALTSKTLSWLAVPGTIIVFAVLLTKRNPGAARLHARKFSQRLPRSWPRLSDVYPAQLVSSSQP